MLKYSCSTIMFYIFIRIIEHIEVDYTIGAPHAILKIYRVYPYIFRIAWDALII